MITSQAFYDFLYGAGNWEIEPTPDWEIYNGCVYIKGRLTIPDLPSNVEMWLIETQPKISHETAMELEKESGINVGKFLRHIYHEVHE